METQNPTSLPNAGVWKIACPTPSCTRLLILPPGSNELPLCQHCSRAELAKEAAFASRVDVKEREQELKEYRRERRAEGSKRWRRGLRKWTKDKDVVKDEDKKGGQKVVGEERREQQCKTAKKLMKERNEKSRAAAAAGKYAGTSNEAMSRYESVPHQIKVEDQDEATPKQDVDVKATSDVEKAAERRSERHKLHRRSNSYNSLFIKLEEDEPRPLKRTRDDMSRSKGSRQDQGKELFPGKARTKSRVARGRRGHDSGYAAAPSTVKSEESSSSSPRSSSLATPPERKVGAHQLRHKHRRSPLRSPSALRRGVLEPLLDPPKKAIKHEDKDEEGEPAVQPRPEATKRGKKMMATINNILRQHPTLQVTRRRDSNRGKALLASTGSAVPEHHADPPLKTENEEVEATKPESKKTLEIQEPVDNQPRRRSELMKRRAFRQGSIDLALPETAMPATKEESEEEDAPKCGNDGSSVSVQPSEQDSSFSPKVPRSPRPQQSKSTLSACAVPSSSLKPARTEALLAGTEGLKRRTCDPEFHT